MTQIDVGTDWQPLLQLLTLSAFWLLIPLVPAWATYKITPDQKATGSGGESGFRLDVAGSFAVYFALALALGFRFWPLGDQLVAQAMGVQTWMLHGHAVYYDEDGKPTSDTPDWKSASFKVVPDINRLGTDISLRVPIDQNIPSIVQIVIPDWGGTEINLGNRELHDWHYVGHTIDVGAIAIRKNTVKRIAVGDVP